MRSLLPAMLLAVACSPPMPGPDGGSPHDGGPSFSCPAGLNACNSACRDLSRDNSNCGACGTICTAAYTCMDSRCTALCDPGLKYCSGACVNTSDDPMNCGACGRQCAASTVCRLGACECPAPTLQHLCGDTCRNIANDPNNCGDCGVTCDAGQTCSGSQCYMACSHGTTRCGPAPGVCHDLMNESSDCGMCGNACTGALVCSGGKCVCPANQTGCAGTCTNLLVDGQNCGGCGISCNGQPCFQGTCLSACPPGQSRCGQLCVDLMSDVANCNACGHACSGSTTCSGGQCVTCNSVTTDCDSDGWLASEGDCCDTPGDCNAPPAEVNPGAIELDNNGVDDNCNGLLDSADTLDLHACDQQLAQGSADGGAYALAMELCRTTVETPATPQQRTWGVISADLLRADGSPLPFPGAASIRSNYGVLMPQAGGRFNVFSTGLAADGSQINPGPNGGPFMDPSDTHNTAVNVDLVDFSTCTSPLCVKDWFNASRPPLKMSMLLPEAPMCGGQTLYPYEANDSVMLRLRMRAPTNARAFQFSALFLSSEYPEYVCSAYNDQLIALVDTASRPAVSNPPDKNLMTYVKGGLPWPVGINVAAGTDLFARCKPLASDPCWAMPVDAQSCSLGDSSLAGTGFEAPMGAQACTTGGGTRWLTTSGNVVPGQTVELRIAIWDVDDNMLDSVVLLDAFKWLRAPAAAGTE